VPTPRSANTDLYKVGLWCLLVAAPGLLIALHDGVYVGNGSDLYSYQLPIRRFVRDSLLQFELPVWNPHVLAGVPLFAGWQAGVLYPPNLLGTPLSPELWLDWSRWLHMFWLALGGHVLAACWNRADPRLFSWSGAVAAALLVGSGPTWGHIYPGHISFVQAWAWLPWVWAGATACMAQPTARTVTALATAVGLQALAGHPQVSLITAAGLVFVTAAQIAPTKAKAQRITSPIRGIAAVVAGGAVGVALSAVQWLPAAVLAPELNRALQQPNAIATAFSAKPAFLWTALAPEAFGGTTARLARFSYHETLSFIGAGGLGLAVLALVQLRLRTLTLWLGLFFMLLLSPGKHGPLLLHVVDWLPGVGAFRVPSRWTAGCVGLLAIVCADVMRRWNDADAPRGPVPMWQSGVVIAVGAGVVAFASMKAGLAETLGADFSTDSGAAADAAIKHAQGAVALAGAATIGLGLVARRPGWQKWAQIAVALLVLVQGWQLATPHQQARSFRDAEMLDWPVEHAAQLATVVGSQGRLATSAKLRQANWGGHHQVSIAGGYEPAVPVFSNRYANFYSGRGIDRYAVNLQVHRNSPQLSRASANHFLQHVGDGRASRRFKSWPVVARLGSRLALRRNPTPVARLAFAAELVIEPDRKRGIERLATVPTSAVVLNEALPHDTAATSVIRKVHWAAQSVAANVHTDKPAVLILRDAQLNGWQVTVDGRPAKSAIADGLFRAVAVAPGEHEVRWQYTAPGLLPGGIISAIALCLLAWLWRRRPRDQARAA
jgi:hypothetical protein